VDKANEIVTNLKELLGAPVVLIGWPQGVKAAKRKWKHLRPEHMTPAYLSKLPRGNIGVALGKVSGGLCAIDWDVEELVQPFLELNPQLDETLQTHGSRGRVFWVRFSGNYPTRTIKLKTHSGREVGEFRSNGSQSIVWGIHPGTKRPYQIVVKQAVVTLDFHSLRWPTEITNPFKTAECTEETEETEELKSCASAEHRLFHSTINTIEDALRVSMPNKKGENNSCLFKLARAIKTLELKKGEKFGLAQLESVFDEWCVRSQKFLRDGQGREEYYLEFMNACQRAKYPLGAVRVAEAWERAKSQPLPSEAMKFENPKIRLLIAFLKEMQVMAGTEPFFITLRDCAALLQQDSHTTVDKWIGALTQLGYVKVAQRGNERKATRYLYVWSA
jgi:Bifunctional DNA primase/polymerase, N-terminal